MSNEYLNPEWEHIPASEYGDGLDVTCKLLRREGQDIEWLYHRLEELSKQSPVTSTVNFPYAVINQDNSFGLEQDGDKWRFSTSKEYKVLENFENTDNIDMERTTAVVDTNENIVTVPTTNSLKIEFKHDNPVYKKYQTSDARDAKLTRMNERWYISWDKDKAYNLHAEMLTHPDINHIPAVCRAQTFAVPSGVYKDNNGSNLTSVWLDDITMNITSHHNTGSPLIIEIRDCVQKKVNKTDKNPTNYPGTRILAREEVRYDNISEGYGVRTIKFHQHPKLQCGKEYAIVLRSPLTCFSKAYAIGGWSSHCKQDPYAYGNAFVSYNNGYTWQIYGKKDDKLTYHYGRMAPKDFGFEINYDATDKNLIYPNKEYTLYFKPIHLNPAEELQISATQDEGDGKITYYVSHDFKKWSQVGGSVNGQLVDWVHKCEDKVFVFVKAVLKNGSSTDPTGKPVINKVDFTIHCNEAKTAYGRCYPINPQLEPALGLNVWGNVDCKVDTSALNTEAKVDIISSDIKSEQFRLITTDEIVDYLYLLDLDSETLTDLQKKETADLIEYFMKNKSAVKTYQENGVFILYDGLMPKAKYEDAGGSYNQRYYVPLKGSPAYPIISCELDSSYMNIDGDIVADSEVYTEWLDYTVSYNQDATEFLTSDLCRCNGDKLKFKDSFVFENTEGATSTMDLTTSEGVSNIDITGKSKAKPGIYTVKYNPVLVKGLNNNEMPFHLDYKTEVFTVTSSEVSDTYDKSEDIKYHKIIDTNDLYLYMQPNCMMKLVKYNDDELTENVDYTVDYDTSKLHLNNITLKVGDSVHVEYVPNIRDTGLSIAYRMHRNNTDTGTQAYILPNSYSYRT